MPDLKENNVIAMKCNVIEPLKVNTLLDGRYFFIPSYQRGYRWTKTQIYDLCNDLLEYILKEESKENNNQGSFYCLQPLIVCKGVYNIDGVEREAFEVIDGQQRITSIFILFRFLAKEKRYESLLQACEDVSVNELYHIFYQTRPDDYSALEKSGFEELYTSDIHDIDIAHVANAYHYLHEWLTNSPENDDKCARATYALFTDKKYSDSIVKEKLFNLISDNNTKGSLQFIWYELDGEKDAIKEFLCENKGKIKLTDTEKIRALFMQRSNFGPEVKDLKQLSIAKDWELIENTLHRNDFWSFISTDSQMEDGRINLIFQFIYEKNTTTTCSEKEGDYLFRYYYQLFATKKKTGLQNGIISYVDSMWNDVMDCFRMLQNWYNNPKVYNLVGLLIKHGYSIKQIHDIYNRESILTNDQFITELYREVRREILDKIPISKGQSDLGIDENEDYIKLFFNIPADKSKMSDLFRFLNVYEINKTIDKALEDINKEPDEKKKSDINRSARDVLSHIYRFPFEALDVFGWDIEHVDSATTNSLTEPKEQEAWVKEASESISSLLEKDDNYRNLELAYKDSLNVNRNATLKMMVERIRFLIGEDESDVRKNWIGNLTLLDLGTNRSYQNKIFAWKGDIIKERIKAGVFVPICTQNIFNKNYKGCSQGRWMWSIDDKRAYHKYMLDVIISFKKDYADKTEDSE